MKIIDIDGTELTSTSFDEYHKIWENEHPFFAWFDDLFEAHTFGHYAPHVIFTNPFRALSQLTDQIRWAWQRLFRGWDDRVLWGIDYYLAKMLPIWITMLKQDLYGVPSQIFRDGDTEPNGHTSDEIIDIRKKEYYVILDKIITGFEAYEKMMDYGNPKEVQEKLQSDFDIGFKLFKDWFSTLSD